MTQATQMIQNPPLISPHQKIDIIVGATLAVALDGLVVALKGFVAALDGLVVARLL